MFVHRFFAAVDLSKTIAQLQTRFYVRAPFPNKLTHYLRRAQLIDSIRLALRSDSPNYSALLNDRLIDSFIVVHALRSAPNADSALRILQNLEASPHFSHTQATLHALATVLAKSRRSAELKTLISDINSGRFRDCRVSLMNLLQWYSAIGDLHMVINTWNEYRQKEKRVCTESYNIVMSVYAKMGKHFEAVETFSNMIDEGAIPNSRTYTVMIEHLVNCGKLDSAMKVFSVLPLMRIKRTLKQFSVLVEGFVGVGQFDEVKTLLNEMRNDGKFPGRSMCVSLQRMQEAGFVEETDDFLREMLPDDRIKSVRYCEDSSDEEEDDIINNDCGEGKLDEIKLKPWLDPKALADALNEWSPEVVSVLEDAKFVWTTRLVCKVLRQFKSPETAWDFFCWVAYQPGYTHDVYTVERLMAILARHGYVELVDRLIFKIRREGMRLPFGTIRLLIDFYGISKKADAALKVFYDDRTLCGPVSNFNLMLLYSSLLRTLTKCKRDSDAINVFEEMILNGVCPDIQTFSGLMYHFALLGDIKTVQKLFTMVRQSGVEPDAYMYKVLIQAYCKCERAALAYRVFEDLSNTNLLPDAATKELLVKSLWKEGKRKEAAAVEERCEEINEVLPLALRGHIWTVNSGDLTRVYNIYLKSFSSMSS
ncbi:pentatricopeptide repeat-containing protein At5g66631 [Mangifera indica]|uniref:pentatricopeptide repeat-containing protein At5g66631 n=1 Tax=Mangifera indica TaxID=29780 RepID=UPI001CFBE7EB|nr:pentatricopeptide repeat-containing protein At5g66631 [Mangifera indica]